MANTLEIVDLATESKVKLIFTPASGNRISTSPSAFPFPLDQSEIAEIQWYLTDYLGNPYGPAKNRANVVEAGLRNLGRLLFEGVFGSSPEAKEILQQAESQGWEQCRLALVSSRPEFQSLPWELLNHEDTGYLVNQLDGVIRCNQQGPLETFFGDLPSTQFNVLLLTPTGNEFSGNSPTGSVAPEALSAMESSNVKFGLDCLRPASLQALEDQLTARTGSYHLVHLDGFDVDSDGLAFQASTGGTERVTASRLAKTLNAGRVPVALLTGSSPEYALPAANELVLGGVPSVAVLPFPLSGAGRQLFTQAFYDALVRGSDAAQAVSTARKALMDSPHRPSASGPAVSWDWVTPVVYQAMEYFPAPVQPDETDAPIPGMLSAQPEQLPYELPRGGPYGLIGRRSEVLDLERSFASSPVVLLTGDVGGGKSELALGFASWMQKSGGRPGGVFYTSFDAGAGLEKVLHETGTALAGLEFGDLRADDRRRWLLDYFREHDTLLVWDRVENLAGFPTGSPGLLEDQELAELDAFLAEAAQSGHTWVLLVSRRQQEPWLSTPYSLYQLGGLAPHDRIEFSTRLLEESGVDAGRLGPEYLELLELVEGHPLAMEMAVPMLKEVPASVVVGVLRKGTNEYQPGADEEVRPSYLTVLMDHAFSRMSRRNRNHLPFLSLFRDRVMLDILTHITQEGVYRSVTGEQLGWGACRALFRSARDSGFLEPVTPSVYQIHPSLPWFYGRSLYRQFPQSAIGQLEAEFVRVYADTADYFMETLYENQDAGTTAILAEEGNLTQALALALEARQWDNVQLLVQPIAQVYRMQKRYPELRRLRRQLLESTGNTAADAAANGAAELWLYLLGTEASECIETGELDRADEMNQQLLEHLSSQEDGGHDPHTAAVYHQIGQVALKRWRLDEAEVSFTKSLAIIEYGEDRASVADDYYSLGLVRQHRRRYTEAKEWFSKALDIHQRLEDAEEMVKDYRSLGLCAQFKFEYQEAESWYHRAREILEEARDEDMSVLVYHSLGTVCHAQYQFDDAENWYQQSLTLSDRLGNEAQMAIEFHHLGLLAQARQIFFDDAEHWYTMALGKFEKLGDWKSAGDECRQLAVLFHEHKKLEEAESWYHRAREVFEEIQDLSRIARTYGQLGMVAEERDDIQGALQWAGRTYQLARDNGLPVMNQVRAHLARLRDTQGEDNFAQWWRSFADEEPPTDLDVDTQTPI